MQLRTLRTVYTSQKSFYGKAQRLSLSGDGEYLFSYNTQIAYTNGKDLKLLSTYEDDYSRTTMRHLNEFAKQSAGFTNNIGIKDVRNALAGDLIIKGEA